RLSQKLQEATQKIRRRHETAVSSRSRSRRIRISRTDFWIERSTCRSEKFLTFRFATAATGTSFAAARAFRKLLPKRSLSCLSLRATAELLTRRSRSRRKPRNVSRKPGTHKKSHRNLPVKHT